MKKFHVHCPPATKISNKVNGKLGGHSFEFQVPNLLEFEIGDEYHSMHELYEHRMALNIVLFQAWKKEYEVMKSKLHNDGTMFEGYFIVMALTPEGQISYHYKLKHWNKFDLSEVERTPKWDGHSSIDVIDRLIKLG